jgi:hypothetical protein
MSLLTDLTTRIAHTFYRQLLSLVHLPRSSSSTFPKRDRGECMNFVVHGDLKGECLIKGHKGTPILASIGISLTHEYESGWSRLVWGVLGSATEITIGHQVYPTWLGMQLHRRGGQPACHMYLQAVMCDKTVCVQLVQVWMHRSDIERWSWKSGWISNSFWNHSGKPYSGTPYAHPLWWHDHCPSI